MIADFDNKTAVVTGGGGYIGRALCLAFAEAGMNVMVADLEVSKAEGVASEVRRVGTRAAVVQTDVADPHSMEALAHESYRLFGAVHLLCNNAGVNVMRPIPELTYEDWRRVLSVNLEGVVNGLLAFLPRLIAQGGERHIVNTASMSGVGLGELRPHHAPYVASKFGIVGLSEVLAPAMSEYGIGVSVVCPGLVSDEPRPLLKAASAAWYENDLVTAAEVAQQVLRAVQEDRLHVFTQARAFDELERRHVALAEDFARSGFRPPLADRPTSSAGGRASKGGEVP